jgi:TRAP-type transport system periplasmic protein
MKKSWKQLIATAVLAAALPLAHAADVKFGFGIVDDHPLGVGAKRLAELVKQRSNGRLNIVTYSSNKIGSDPQMQQGLQAGLQEMMLGPPSNLVGVIKDFAYFDLPFSITSYAEADALLDGTAGALLLKKMEAANLVGLAYWETGFREVTNSKRPITRAEDLVGLKIRVMQNAVFMDSFKALGANAVPMAFTELYTALETKAVDAQENPVGIIDGAKIYEVQKYLSLTNHVYNPSVVMASKKWWDTLAEADRKLIKDAAQEVALFQRKLVREQVGKTIERLKAGGMLVNELPAAEIERIRDKTRPVVAKYSQQIDPAVVAAAQADLARVKGR